MNLKLNYFPFLHMGKYSHILALHHRKTGIQMLIFNNKQIVNLKNKNLQNTLEEEVKNRESNLF